MVNCLLFIPRTWLTDVACLQRALDLPLEYVQLQHMCLVCTRYSTLVMAERGSGTMRATS